MTSRKADGGILAALENDAEFGRLVEEIREDRIREGLNPDTGESIKDLPVSRHPYLCTCERCQ